MMKQ